LVWELFFGCHAYDRRNDIELHTGHVLMRCLLFVPAPRPSRGGQARPGHAPLMRLNCAALQRP
jgi:hypothetical protein